MSSIKELKQEVRRLQSECLSSDYITAHNAKINLRVAKNKLNDALWSFGIEFTKDFKFK